MEEVNLHWKERAIERRLENKELNKRRRELIKSRDNWKRKCIEQKSLADSLKKEIASIKKKLNEIVI
jgi:hypothetical protein